MNYLHRFLDFETSEEGLKKLKEAEAVRDQMGGALYYGILSDDCSEISSKIYDLETKERHERNRKSTD